MNLKLYIKSSDVLKEATEKVKKKIEDDLKNSVKVLGKGALKEAEKLAQENLPTSLENIYKDSLYIEELSENMVAIGVREDAEWIEKGRRGGFMEELLNRKSGSEVKESKDGNKYRVIPFKHSTEISKKSSSGNELVNELKTFLRRQGVPYSKSRALALDENGSPRIGKIHSFNIMEMRNKGKKGAASLSRNLQGVSIFQNKNPITGKVERNIMTFRVISEKHRGSKWEHPGRNGEEILSKTFQWVQDTWQRDLLPELKRKYGKR
jgi:hypothetical protein